MPSSPSGMDEKVSRPSAHPMSDASGKQARLRRAGLPRTTAHSFNREHGFGLSGSQTLTIEQSNGKRAKREQPSTRTQSSKALCRKAKSNNGVAHQARPNEGATRMCKMNYSRPTFRMPGRVYESINGAALPEEFRSKPREKKSKAELRHEAAEAKREFDLKCCGRSSSET